MSKNWRTAASCVLCGLSIAVSICCAPALAQAQTRELVVAAWGDPYEAGWRKSLIPSPPSG